MRVLVIGEVSPDSFADNVQVSLADAGHTVRAVPPFTGPLAGRGRLRSRLLNEAVAFPQLATATHRHVVQATEDFGPDVVLNLDYRLSWPIVDRIRDAGRCPVAFWYPDAVGNLGREAHTLASYDAVFVKDSVVAERYRDMLGMNALYLPEACNPRWHRPIDGVRPADGAPALLVAGNLYATRYRLLRMLMDAGIGIELHGPPPPRWLTRGALPPALQPRPYLAREAKARAFRGSFAVLNSLAVHEADGLNCRLFEAAACGAVVLTEHRSKLPSLFDVGTEVLAFSTYGELLEKIQYVQSLDAGARTALGDSAARRAHGEHTYAHRFDSILVGLGRG